MNMIVKLPDEFTLDHKFDDVEIEEDGLYFGSFSGVAELGISQPGEPEFYVKHITISGRRVSKYSAFRRDSYLNLYRPSNECRTFTAHLFRKLEQALYADADVQEWFTKECGE